MERIGALCTSPEYPPTIQWLIELFSVQDANCKQILPITKQIATKTQITLYANNTQANLSQASLTNRSKHRDGSLCGDLDDLASFAAVLHWRAASVKLMEIGMEICMQTAYGHENRF